MTLKLQPRWKPMWKHWPDASQNEVFLGHAGEIDVYFEDHGEDGNGAPDPRIYVVCGPSRVRRGDDGYNFDGYRIVEGNLVLEDERHDVHIELDEMCEVYNLAVKCGHIELEDEDAS